MKKRILLAFVMLLIICFSVSSQENELPETTEATELTEATEELAQQQESPDYNSDSVFVINSFVFHVDGITLPFMMINKAELVKGEEIKGYSNLIKYIADKQQLLVNERVLQTVRIEHSIGEQREDGKHPVDLVIHVKDTNNIMAIPRPQYSSNSGFDITIKARDYNFLGTMNSLRVDVGYQHDEDGNNSFSFMIDSGIPFEAFGLNWFFDFDHSFKYRPDLEQQYYYKNDTGLSVEMSIARTTINIGFEESFVYNEENSESDWPAYGRFQEGLYMSSYPYISWKIPTGLEINEYGELTYTPKLSARFYHELPEWPLDKNRIGPNMYFSHNLGFGRVDWIGNFRKGFSASVSNSFDYNFYSKSIGSQPLSAYYDITGKGYFIIRDFLGVSSRIMFRNWINTSSDSGGDVLRGVMDNDLNIDYMLSLNLDITLRLFQFRPSEWFKSSKFRYFNFDLHLGPIIDAAFSHDPSNGTIYGFNNLNLTGGLEMIIYPTAFRSLYLRISAATDLYRMIASERGPIEIFIGTDLHY